MSDTAQQKTCFVTIGATASFDKLIKTALSEDFGKALESQGYTHLLVQYGEDGKDLYESCLDELKNAKDLKVKIDGFDLDEAGLRPYIAQAKGVDIKGASEGVVISHAGNSQPSIQHPTKPHITNCFHRLRHHPRCHAHLSTAHRRAKPGLTR